VVCLSDCHCAVLLLLVLAEQASVSRHKGEEIILTIGDMGCWGQAVVVMQWWMLERIMVQYLN
jgi:hypothetical protein